MPVSNNRIDGENIRKAPKSETEVVANENENENEQIKKS